MAPKVVAVTGASGFIGAHVVLALLRRGYIVHACVRNKDDAKNKFLLELGGPVRLFSALLLDEGAYDAAFAGAVGVIHVAAVLAIAGSADPIADMVEPSTRGTRNVLDSVARCGVAHYVHTSSSAAMYDARKGAALDEADWNPDKFVPGGGTDAYPFAKTEGERAVWELVAGQPFTCSCINPTMVFGPCLAKQHAKASPFVFRQALCACSARACARTRSPPPPPSPSPSPPLLGGASPLTPPPPTPPPLLPRGALLSLSLSAADGNPYPNTPLAVVDVRDVADAHVEALERHADADGLRFVLDGGDDTVPANEHVRVAARLFPQYAFALSEMKDPPTRAQHPRGYVRRQWDNGLSKRVLGLRYTSRVQCIRDTVASMVETGWVPTKAKAKL